MNTDKLTERGYSPDVAEILNRKPHWIIRRGMLVVAIIFGAALFGTWFVDYPERLNCTITFTNSRASVTKEISITGIIRLPENYETVIRKGMPVKVLLAMPRGTDPLTSNGQVDSVARGSAGGYLSVMIRLHSDPATIDKFRTAGQANAQIITGSSNLLQQIFNPVLSVIRGTRQNQKQGK
jgi:hypothetical protein